MNLLVFNLKTDADDSVLGFTTDWINALAKRCDRVIVITMCMGRLSVDKNVTVFSVGKEKGYSEPRRLIEFYRILSQVIHTENIDACFAHMIQIFAILGWPLLKVRSIPIILWYAHGHVPLSLRIATALVDKVVSSSPSGFRIKTRKLRSIGQGIDINRFSPAPVADKSDPTIRILTLGRLSPVKRLETAIEAISLISPSRKETIELRYIGDGIGEQGQKYREHLKHMVEASGLEKTVVFQSALPFHRVQEGYQSANIFINSSDTNSMDKTVLEAMSCGLPVITSNEAFLDVLGEELASKWCIPKNKPDILAARIEQLIEMGPKQRQKLGLKLRECVKASHSLEILSKRLIAEAAPQTQPL
ncbi:MAG: glycosyltransferase family 4 protein [Phormidesmis sp.]